MVERSPKVEEVGSSVTAPKNINTVEDIDFLLDLVPQENTAVDLSRTTFVRPVGVVAILATLERLTKTPGVQEVNFTAPANRDVNGYLRSVGVFDAMREHGQFRGTQPEDVYPELNLVRPMVSCTHFHDEAEILNLGEQMEERFRTEFQGFGSLLGTVDTVFSELANNVVYHADSGGGYVLAQEYRYSGGPVVEIAVADCGIGIRESLRKNPNNSGIFTDVQAIESALQEGVSSIREQYRGYGLHHVSYDVQRHRSREMTIRSGTGTITLHGDGRLTILERRLTYPGTIVSVTIPSESS